MPTKKSRLARDVIKKHISAPLSIGVALAAIRRCEEMSLVQFGALLGISSSHLSDIEKGRKLVSAELAAAYARKLGYSETQFIRLALQDSLNRQGLAKFHVVIEAA